MADDVRSLDGKRLIWTPSPRQKVALTCPAFEIMYGGAKGGGKTDLLVMAMMRQLAVAHEKWKRTHVPSRGRFIIFRKNIGRLDEIMGRAERLYPQIDPDVVMPTDKKRKYLFLCGYRVEFEHLDDPDSHKAYEGQEITLLGFDQVEEIPEKQYNVLRAQLRTTDDDLRPLLQVISTSNPGGTYGAWVKERFVAACPTGNKIVRESQKLRDGTVIETTRAFIPAKLWDNKYLCSDGRYEANLRSLNDPALLAAYIEGDWDFVVGAKFAHLWRARVHVVEPEHYFDVQAHWRIQIAGDWGETAPACCLFWTRNNDGNILIVDEIYEPGVTGSVFAEKIKRRVAEHARDAESRGLRHPWHLEDINGPLDPSAWTKHEGSSPALTMRRLGIRWWPANNDRMAGKDQVVERLYIRDNGRPALYVFRRCANLIRTLPTIPADENNPEDVDTKSEDHAYDALRYGLMSCPIDSARPENDHEQHELDHWDQLMRSNEEKRRERSDIPDWSGYS